MLGVSAPVTGLVLGLVMGGNTLIFIALLRWHFREHPPASTVPASYWVLWIAGTVIFWVGFGFGVAVGNGTIVIAAMLVYLATVIAKRVLERHVRGRRTSRPAGSQ